MGKENKRRKYIKNVIKDLITAPFGYKLDIFLLT